MKVILTEKPSVARDIARCLNIRNKRDGYFEGNGYRITWAFGHLVELKEPDDYHKEWKRWSLESLPIIPEKFGLKARGDASAKKQLNTIRHLFKEADEIICATDAGREGELIFRYILSWSQCLSKPFKRLWISSLTDEAIRKGFAQLQDGRLYDNLYRAAKCRSESDWIVGLNATRLYTLKFGQNGTLWTIGRVQTPVLALIVQRDAEIANFIPKDFWELQTLYRNTVFQYAGGRFDRQVDAVELLSRIDGHEFQIMAVKGKKETVNPPLLYDLADLQKDMSMRYGFTAERTLTCAQQLYEKKHITYPRTGSRYLSDDMKADMKPLLEKLRRSFGPQIAPLDLDGLALNARYFNNVKVTDHHAIIPTTTLPDSLSSDEAKLYQVIVIRFIAAFYPPCIRLITTVQGETNHTKFNATGIAIESPGWQVLYKGDDKQETLPDFTQGETGLHQPSVSQGKTKPPKPYTEATLLSMMESAGKTCDDEVLKDVLKEKGLGTPATRASIIETLIMRNYIKRQKKNLISTEAGRYLIAIIADDRLKSAAMTGEWEFKLKKIEQNAHDPDQFMMEIIQFISGIILFTQKIKDESIRLPEAVIKPPIIIVPPDYDANKLGECPLCHKPVIEGRKGYGCSGWKEGCQFVLWKEAYGVSITYEIASQLLQNGRTLQAYDVHVGNKTFDAHLTLNGQGETSYIKAASQSVSGVKEAIAACPLCNGQIIETPKAYSCSEWRNGCKAVIWKTIAHKKITAAMAKKMIATGQTGVLKGFKSAKGSAFDANLKFVDGKVQMDFSKPA